MVDLGRYNVDFGVPQIEFIQLNELLITTLVEHRGPKIHPFHISREECTTTLQDVIFNLDYLKNEEHETSGKHDNSSYCNFPK